MLSCCRPPAGAARQTRARAGRAATDPGRLCRDPADQRPGRTVASRPRRRLPDLRSPPAGFGRDHAPAVRRRLDRPPGPDPLPDRSEPLPGAGDAGRRQSPERQGQRRSGRTRAQRYRPLAAMEAVSKQDYTDARPRRGKPMRRSPRTMPRFAPPRSTCATPACRRRSAAVSAARNSPRARWSRPTRRTPLATITRLDPVYVDIQQSAPELLALRRSLSQGGAAPCRGQVRLKLPDGSDYGYTGTVQFTEVVVDAGTGTVTLRARFPNPQSLLLPGMFVTRELRPGDRHHRLSGAAGGGFARSQGQCDCGSSDRATRPSRARSSPNAPTAPIGW